MTSLADLVRARREQLHLSFAALGMVSLDPESEAIVTASWLHRLESAKPVVPPQLAQLRAMAAGLQLPLAQIQEAAAEQFFGLEPGAITSAEILALAARLQQLSPKQREALNGFLDAFSPLPAGLATASLPPPHG